MFWKRAKRPVSKVEAYLKYGFVVTAHEYFYCPRCGEVLNAGPNYHPQYCRKCGQKVDFEGIEWKADKELGFLRDGKESYEQVKNRVV